MTIARPLARSRRDHQLAAVQTCPFTKTRMSAPKKLRKQYTNTQYPMVVMKFEDGHEIKVYQNTGKVFDVWAGETIKLMAVYDPTSKEWELIEARKSDAFDDAPAGS
jgi:hypothetical protein